MRVPFIAGNWKMHPPPTGAFDKGSPFFPHELINVVIFPTFLDLHASINAGIHTGGQCGHPEESGAHTGDISMAMLKSIGCTYVLCGHSERRSYHGENNEDVALQAKAALAAGLHPVVCVGETDIQRKSGNEKTIVKSQVQALPIDEEIIVAYEPIWAIGTGNTASPAQAQEMHEFIRSLLPNHETTRIIYGGSMKPENAEELLSLPDIDGGLIGGASLKPNMFKEIIEIASNLAKRNI